jgi:hypothetical protein
MSTDRFNGWQNYYDGRLWFYFLAPFSIFEDEREIPLPQTFFRITADGYGRITTVNDKRITADSI